MSRRCIVHILRDARDDFACEIDEDDGDVIAVDVDADRVAGIGADLELGRRLSPAAPTLARFGDEPCLHEAFGDVRDRGRRQTREPGQLDTGHLPPDADRMERDPLVVIGRALEVRA